MCQGIRDVVNLCWKLEEVFAGRANVSLLETYEQERSQHVLTLTSRIKAIGHHICERDPEAARLRDETLLAQGGGKAPTVTRQEIVPPIEAGLLADDGNKANGTLFPQPWIDTPDGPVHMDKLTGVGWRLIVDGRTIASEDADKFDIVGGMSLTRVVVGGHGLPEKDDIVAHWFLRHACHLAIVRPDHYVYGVALDVKQARQQVQQLNSILAVPEGQLASSKMG